MSLERLIINASLIFSLFGCFSIIIQCWHKKTVKSQFLLGLVFAIIAIVSMSFPLQFKEGLIFDGRSISLTMAGLFGGPIAAVVAATLGVSYRLSLGGIGALAGAGTMLTSVLAGLLFYRFREQKKIELNVGTLAVHSLIVHAVVLLWMLALPNNLKWEVLKTISLPFLSILPAGSVFVGLMLYRQEKLMRTTIALKEKEERFNNILESMSDGIAILKPINGVKDFLILYQNRSFDHFKNRKKFTDANQSFLDEFPEASENGLIKQMQRVWQKKVRIILPTATYHAGKMTRWRETEIFSLSTGEVVLIHRDKTEKKIAEHERNQLFDLSMDMFCIAGFDGYFKQINPAFQNTLGWSEKEILNRPWIEWVHPEDKESTIEVAERLSAGEKVLTFRNRYRSKDGSYRWLSWSAYPHELDKRIFAVARDITDLIHNQKTLEENRAQVEAIFHAADDIAFIITDADEKEPTILEFSQGAEKIFEYSRKEVIGDSLSMLLKKMKRNILLQAENKSDIRKEISRTETTLFRKSGKSFPAMFSTYPMVDKTGDIYAILNLAMDLSESEKLRQQVHHTQRMEAIGTLSAGIAHDFNNLLTTILGNAHLLMGQVNKESEIYEDLNQIRLAGDRAANLTRQLLAFSRKQIIETEIISINNSIDESKKLLERIIGENIEFRIYKDDELHNIKADKNQVEQVILNLVVNARDAMPNGGVITINTKNVSLDQQFFKEKGVTGIPGSYAKLSVSDTGEGIHPELVDKIFDPFFTTKPKDKGTGMGLSTVYGIMKQANGFVWASGVPGEGSTFDLFWPSIDRNIDSPEKIECLENPNSGRETILVVEDESSVLRLIKKTLESAGYKVLSAQDGEEALKISDAYEDSIQLLLTDVVMPKMSGYDLIEKLSYDRTNIDVLMMSGYSETNYNSWSIDKTKDFLLMKPVTPDELLKKVRKIFDVSEKYNSIAL